MTREVLPTDVEFARRMIDSSHSDAEILPILASRGIVGSAGGRLLDDLRHGRLPESRVPYASAAVVPRGVSQSPPAAVMAPPVPAPAPVRAYRRTHRRRSGAWWFMVMLIIFAWAFGYAVLHIGTDASEDAIQKVKHDMPPPPNKQ